MKVRVLYPTGVEHIKPGVVAGQVVVLDDDLAAALAADGAVEPVKVERATQAPGEKRVRRPKRGE